MCTLVILFRPGHDWPLLLGANRDERRARPSAAPGRHWEDRPEVLAGLDHLAGGSWLGINDHGLAAAAMNREGSLGPAAGKRSRGELVLEALDHAEAARAAEALRDLDPRAYRPFNLFVGDPRAAFWLRHGGDDETPVACFPVPPGVHMLTARDLDDVTHPRIQHYLPRFREAAPPDPTRGIWEPWSSLLASRIHPRGDGPQAAMNLQGADDFGTVSSALIAIPAYPRLGNNTPVWLHADGAPAPQAYRAVEP